VLDRVELRGRVKAHVNITMSRDEPGPDCRYPPRLENCEILGIVIAPANCARTREDQNDEAEIIRMTRMMP